VFTADLPRDTSSPVLMVNFWRMVIVADKLGALLLIFLCLLLVAGSTVA